MESILFEKKIFFKQEASLCAQHALNMLLQGHYFSASDLATIAHDLDERENSMLSTNIARSQNMDDSGYFSVQVIAEALRVFNLELISFTSSDAVEFQRDPTCGAAYICNLNEHWFVIRRFGFQWFKLNSLLSSPELLSDTYLSLYLAQLVNDGYTIFVVVGELPHCKADEILSQCPVIPLTTARNMVAHENQLEDEDLAQAIALSLAEIEKDNSGSSEGLEGVNKQTDEINDLSLQQALEASAKEAKEREDEYMTRQLQYALQMSLDEQAAIRSQK
uniref:Ataxin-3 homolog n=1 Tax=Syphacia muris TaxID=451379 RepID=A0A0N5AQA7_9BILA